MSKRRMARILEAKDKVRAADDALFAALEFYAPLMELLSGEGTPEANKLLCHINDELEEMRKLAEEARKALQDAWRLV